MVDVNAIVDEYTTLRDRGMGPKEALHALRSQIESLPREAKVELAGRLRSKEETQPPKAAIKPLKPAAQQKSIVCANCGYQNRLGEVVCVNCGTILGNTLEHIATRKLSGPAPQDEHFDENSTLILRVRDTEDRIQVRPQDSDHEVVVGRRDAKGTFQPDVDLSPFDAASQGVSRIHMSVIYDAANQCLNISDMNSANGVYVNGQRLISSEVRALRHGDQLRLGNFVMEVLYRHLS